MLPACLALAALTPSLSGDWYVDASASAPGDGSPSAPYTRIDYAVAQPTTRSGDTIHVRPGIYPNERIHFTKKRLEVIATGSASDTVIRGAGDGSVISIRDAPLAGSSTFEGFTIEGGRGEVDPSTGLRWGGAAKLDEANAVLLRCVIRNCDADFGGVIAISNSDVTGFTPHANITQTVVEDSCFARIDGGAIHATEAQAFIVASRVDTRALSGRGGAICRVGVPTHPGHFVGVLFSRVAATSAGDGGALFSEGAIVRIEDSEVSGRSLAGGRGGAVFVDSEWSSSFVRSSFVDCTSGRGGAIDSIGPAEVRFSAFMQCTATHWPASEGGALHGEFDVLRSSFIHSRASNGPASIARGPQAGGVAVVHRCAFDRVDGSLGFEIDASYDVAESVVEGGHATATVIDADPSFWGRRDPGLLPDSPAYHPIGADYGSAVFDPWHCGEGCTGRLGQTSCLGVQNSLGSIASLTALGSSSVDVDRVVMNVGPVPSDAQGEMLASTTPDFVVGPGGSEGNLCLGGTVARLGPAQNFPANSTRRTLRSSLPITAGGVVAGQTWYFQYWYRYTVAGAAVSNYSDSIAISFE